MSSVDVDNPCSDPDYLRSLQKATRNFYLKFIRVVGGGGGGGGGRKILCILLPFESKCETKRLTQTSREKNHVPGL